MEFLQLGINGLVSASLYALVAVGFAAIYRTSGFLHFAHAASYAIAPYVAYSLISIGCPFPSSLFIGILFSASLGVASEVSIFQPLRRQKASSLVSFLASLGLFIILQNLLSLVWGDDVKTIRPWTSTPLIAIGDARITSLQIAMITIAAASLICLALFLRRTRAGLLVRAVADDGSLARSTGINTDRVLLLVFALASGLGGLAGTLAALDTDMTPSMGVNMLFLGIAAFILGGARNIMGGIAGALAVAMLRQAGAWYFGAKWQEAIVFALILGAFLCKPTGLLPEKRAFP